MLMNYVYTYPDAKIRYYVRNMQLYINSGVAYLVLPKARSRGAGYVYINDEITNTDTIPKPKNNGPILIDYQTIKGVIPSVVESEITIVHLNCKDSTSIQVVLNKMLYPQYPIPLRIDHDMVEDFQNQTIKPKRSKLFDMQFHCMIDRIK